MHSIELKHTTTASPEKLWLALTDPKYSRQWDGNRWGQNDACVGGQLRARTEEGTLFTAEILIYDVCERLAVLAQVPVNPEEPEEGTYTIRQEFTLEPQQGKTTLHVKFTGFPDESSATMMRNTWGGFYLEKIGKVAESVSEKDVAQFSRPIALGNDFPGDVRHTELATILR
ncbi:MAG: SRPBCC domain-containing protein [Calditrichaeota bacterium]|nr:SRPBCC domain-containing protein [Calditrichota bacterium]MCB9369340.1 SRPBCC domain-containing protein [Calditrichota bacterium]